MSLETIYYIGQTIAAAGILGSLVAIWFQQRQSIKIARADMTERTLGKFYSAMEIMTQDPDLSLHYMRLVRGQVPADEAIVQRLVWFFSLMMQAHASSYFLWRDHLSDDRTIDPHNKTILVHLKVPLFNREWERTRRRGTFPVDYMAFVEKLRLEADRAARSEAPPRQDATSTGR
ncbi:hypothetical protein [Hyphomonas johnsonii]|uniref:DUF4760 domain-containing protein n=1 Tax=Hyphomonas johnsonii MHS-2 TaxID=1280950 RepID=A0A059FU89_9PROT|nr:hypothetical protein [Hyphomonas johnsonii]KCZ94041.1 hypothetical protein HJO_01660 [Hyphomonas johnsonii MHS-2]